MIKIYIYKNKLGNIYGYKVTGHSSSIICSAVSTLALNTVNSIEVFTSENYICNYEKKGGFLHLEIPNIKNSNLINKDVELLINSFLLGVTEIKSQYNNNIKIIYIEK